MDTLEPFREIWLADFEFCQPDGERPQPLCMVAREFRTGETRRFWRDDLVGRNVAPIPVDPGALFVAYYASAELGCFLALNWPLPVRILDLFCEFRNRTNGSDTMNGNGLLGALAYFGFPSIEAADKTKMRELAQRPGPHTGAERRALLDYCETDVLALARLLPRMLPEIDIPRAILRGRSMAAVARMERTGIPIDVPLLDQLRESWAAIKTGLVCEVDREFGVYEGQSFRAHRFADYLIRAGIPWPRLLSGTLALDDDTFRQMAKGYPQIAPLRELRHSLGEMRLFSDLAVGCDGRNRCLLSPFRSVTSRNQPSSARFIFGPAIWLRGMIRPTQGYALAYIDWSQQEFGIAAALSGDRAMMEAYTSGDPYLQFAKQAGAVPSDATKASHSDIREQFKVCALAVQYRMAGRSLADRLGVCEARARELLRLHRRTYPTFWRWSQAAVDHAMLRGWLQTVFGWRVHVGPAVNSRSLANFPMQANGAEMLRLACCLATERGVTVCAPVHDALLIEATEFQIDEAVADCQAAMREASSIVLDGFELRSDAKIVRHPDRYSDPRGKRFWATVWGLIGDPQTCSAGAHPIVAWVHPNL